MPSERSWSGRRFLGEGALLVAEEHQDEGEGVFVITANGNAVTGSGKVISLTFEVAGEAGDVSPVSLEKFEVNETAASGGFRANDRVCREIRLNVADESTDATSPR